MTDEHTTFDRRTMCRLIGGAAVAGGMPAVAGAHETDDTVAYESLGPRERLAFRQAVSDGGVARFGPQTQYVENAGFAPHQGNVFREHQTVTREGTTYDISMTQEGLASNFLVTATPAEPDTSASVTPIDEVSGARRGAVRQAVETGQFAAPAGRWESIGDLSNIEFVRAEGQTFDIQYMTGDVWISTLRVTPA